MATSSPPQPIGVYPQFFTQKLETLFVGEGGLSMTKNNFIITLSDGTPILRADSNPYSRRRKVYDASGKHLFDVVKSRAHALTDLAVVDPNGKEIMSLKNKFSMFSIKGTATFTSQSGKAEVLTIKGGTSSVVITDQSRGAVVAHLQRKTANFLTGKQQLTLQVMPGVDMALMAALAFEFIKRIMGR